MSIRVENLFLLSFVFTPNAKSQRPLFLNNMDAIRTLKELLTLDLAIDMGTTATRIFNRGGNIALDEPSCIAVSGITGEVVSVGRDAHKLLGRCPPHIEVAFPVVQGAVREFDLAELMMQRLMRRLLKARALFGAAATVVVPAGATDVEVRAFEDVVLHSGVRSCRLIEAPVAAAIGLSLPIERPRGTAVFLLGGGTTQAAVFSGGNVLFTECARVGGQDINEAITAGIRKKFGAHVGRHTVEQIKTALGSAYPMEKDETREVYVKDAVNGLPRAIFVSNWEIREMIVSPLETIVGAVKSVLERVPPEMAEDIKKNGIFLTGGCSLMRGMSRLIEEISGVGCTVSKKGAYACLSGADKVLGAQEKWRGFTVSRHTRKLSQAQSTAK